MLLALWDEEEMANGDAANWQASIAVFFWLWECNWSRKADWLRQGLELVLFIQKSSCEFVRRLLCIKLVTVFLKVLRVHTCMRRLSQLKLRPTPRKCAESWAAVAIVVSTSSHQHEHSLNPRRSLTMMHESVQNSLSIAR